MEKVELDDGRSQVIEADDKRILKKLLKDFRTKRAAARALGINRATFNNALNGKTCHPDTLKVVREYSAQNGT